MKKIKNCMRSAFAVFTVMAVIFSLILPLPDAKAEGTGKISIHGDISFMKYSTAGNKPLEGTRFRLSGTSKYGTDVMEYATSDAAGKVKFENIEWGSYKLKEVEAPDGYIADSTEYTATISDSGVGGIDDAEMLKTGSAVIRNEPYHTVEISNQSSYDSATLSGAELRLTGTSDRGTAYDKTAASGDNGLAKFDGLEAGTYIIQETKSPNGYYLDSTKHILRVNKDDTYTIDGLKKNGSGYYMMNNKPEESGKIIVKKKWKDNKTNAERPVPTIHITTDVSKIPTYAVWRNNKWNYAQISNSPAGPFYYVDPDYKNKTKKVEYAKNITSANQVPESAVRLDKNYDDPNAKCKIWGWLTDDGTMYYWTNAQTTRLTDGSNMLFYFMNNAESIDLDKIDTTNVTNMDSMFYGCSSLTSLDLSNFKTSNATDMSHMFESCSSLTLLDVSHFNTSNATDMSNMFYNCSKLTSLDVTHFNTSKVTNMWGMFESCSGLTSLDVTHFDTLKVTNMWGMFYDCSGLTLLDVSHFNTSNVTNMGDMFYGCYELTSLDLSNFDTSNVTNMSGMFNMFFGKSKLTSLNVKSFDTSSVTDMSYMFTSCESLTSLDVSNFNTSNVTNMASMFAMYFGNPKLTSLDVSSFDTSKVTDMSNMFDNCSKLTSLDLSKFKTSKVTNMSYMFNDCYELTSLDLSNFDTHNVTDMSDMFSMSFGESKLTSLDVSNFDTSNVTNMESMFYECSSLTSLDLSNFNTSNVTNMESMFYFCTGLTNIYVSDRWNTNKVTSSNNMFSFCSKLPNYSSSIDKTHANYGPDGYLTYKAAPTAKANTSNISFASRIVSMILSRLAVPVHAADSASYVSTDKDHCTITKDGDTWTYEFKVTDDSAKYYAYEDDVEGYTSSNDANSYSIVTKNEPLTITNTAADYNESASLSLSKTADGKQLIENNGSAEKALSETDVADIPSSYSNMAYMFDIALKSSDSSKLSGTKIFGDAVFTDGKAQVGVKAGETKIFSDLPGGTTYTITEKKYDNFYAESKNASGTLNAGDTAEAKFTNHYQKPKGYSSFTLKKNVTGFFQNAQNYTFDVSFRKLEPNTEYSLSDGTKFTSDADGCGYAQIKLGDKESVTFNGLPVGAQYRVTEEGGNWSSAYKITNSTDKGDIAQSTGSAEKNKSLSTEWETVDSGEDITVTYTNTVKKYQNLVLKKAVTGGKVTDKFKFTAEFKNLYETVSSDAGTIVPDNDGTASVDVYLNAGNEIVFKNVPVTAKYKFTEKSNAGKASYTIRTDAPDGVAGGSFVKSADGNTEAMKDLSTEEETVDEGENATVTFLNDMPKTTSVTLKEQASGAFASRSQFFKFTVSLTGAEKKQSYSFDYTNGSDSHDGTKNAASITTDENGNGTADIWLKHDDTVVIKNIPLSAKYSIAENPGGYVPSITINGEKADAVSEQQAAPDVIVFTNTNTAVLPTGIKQHKKAVALACAAIIALLTAVWYILKKCHKKENKAK